MNAEELLQNVVYEDTEQDSNRERLSSIVAGGCSKQYLGRELQLSDIDECLLNKSTNFTADMKHGWVQV